MEILVRHEIAVPDTKQLFTRAYALRELFLSSPNCLATLGEDEPIIQLSIQVKSKSYKDLINELPHATAVMHQVSLFPKEQNTRILPTAILVKSIENTYPFTLQWHFSGGDECFVQVPKVKKASWLSSLFGTSHIPNTDSGGSSIETRERFWNVTTKFPTMYGDSYNQLELLGFHGADFRSTTPRIGCHGDQCYYHISTSYKYFKALRHAFIHVHTKRRELRLWLQQSTTLWKVRTDVMDEVLEWIEKECVTDADSCLLYTDKFQVSVEKYNGDGWHVWNEGSRQDMSSEKELSAEVQLLLIYKLANAEVGVRSMSRAQTPPSK